MNQNNSRRGFLTGLGAALSLPLAPRNSAGMPNPPVGVHYGYAAITWGEAEKQAVDDISSAGYKGIQFRAGALTEFHPTQLRELLGQHKLTFVALSSGEISLDPATEEEQIKTHTDHAKFVRDAGGLYLQILDKLLPYPRTVTSDECKRLGKMLTELGKRTADVGIPLGYHNHMNTISEHPQNLELVMESSDPKYVKLELDTAHSLAGGGDPAKDLLRYHDRLLFLHLKDVLDSPMAAGARYPFKFVELGKGKVDLPEVFAAIKKVKFQGWALVELDRVPDQFTTPKEAAITSRQYLEEKIGVKV